MQRSVNGPNYDDTSPQDVTLSRQTMPTSNYKFCFHRRQRLKSKERLRTVIARVLH